ncbi:MAG: helix-turn-helix domain-containing protein [Muribaculaceae bacterium]|nr:helix-turn-helix domain-containing protein [Muribaculaceae bacterium]
MTKTSVVDPYDRNCPVRNILSRIGGKWAILILHTIKCAEEPIRFNEIQRAIPDISQKMLATTLKILEEDGIIRRKAYSEIPPRVEYSLTEVGLSLMPILYNLIYWAKDNMNDIMLNRWKCAKA